MPFIGGGHIWLLLIVLAIVLIVKGPGKLPDMGAGLGRAIKEFRKATTEAHDTVQATVLGAPVPAAQPAPAATPVPVPVTSDTATH